jgi:hypothetical protein
MVAFKLMSSTRFIIAILAITILSGLQVIATGDTCSNIEPQPIGIDFGPSVVYSPFKLERDMTNKSQNCQILP